jgi:hypothetical protein
VSKGKNGGEREATRKGRSRKPGEARREESEERRMKVREWSQRDEVSAKRIKYRG